MQEVSRCDILWQVSKGTGAECTLNDPPGPMIGTGIATECSWTGSIPGLPLGKEPIGWPAFALPEGFGHKQRRTFECLTSKKRQQLLQSIILN